MPPPSHHFPGRGRQEGSVRNLLGPLAKKVAHATPASLHPPGEEMASPTFLSIASGGEGGVGHFPAVLAKKAAYVTSPLHPPGEEIAYTTSLLPLPRQR
jgi:hypothetical protein